MPDTTPQFYTAAEAAAHLGIALGTVYRWLKEGRLERADTPGQVLLTAASVRDCTGKRPLGRPRKQREA